VAAVRYVGPTLVTVAGAVWVYVLMLVVL
jgi:hypothetical protein